MQAGGAGPMQGNPLTVPPTFSSAGASAGVNFAGTTIAVPIPAETGKYAVVCHFNSATNVAPTMAGWTSLLSLDAGASYRSTMFGRRLDGTEGATDDLVVAGGQTGVAICLVYNGVNLALPATALGTGTAFATNTAFNPPDFALAANSLAICMLGAQNSTSFTIGSPSIPFTERAEATFLGGVRASIFAADCSTVAANAAVDPGTWTISPTSANAIFLPVQLNPL